MILLDTNVVSAVMQKHPEPAVLQWLNDQSSAEIWLPSVVVFELRYGAAIHPDPGRRQGLLKVSQSPRYCWNPGPSQEPLNVMGNRQLAGADGAKPVSTPQIHGH